MQVVDSRESRPQHLPRLKEMSQICTREMSACVTLALRINGKSVVFILRVCNIDRAAPGKQHGIPSVPRRQDAVEQIDSPLDRFKQIGRSSDAHQVTRLLLWKDRRAMGGYLVHRLRGFANRQSSDR